MEDENKGIDWSILKKSITFLSICLIIASTLSVGSYYFSSKLEKEYNNNKRIFQSISRKYLDVDQEEKLLIDYYPKFIKLYEKGVIGREKRLNWLETLRQAGEKVNLPSLAYSISSQQEYTPEYNINYNGYSLYRSSMKLTLGLLHEGDLFKLIEYINRTANGSSTLSECTFRMNGEKVVYNKNHANISASCLLYWITIDLSDGREIKIG